jgi:hypothetical protein
MLRARSVLAYGSATPCASVIPQQRACKGIERAVDRSSAKNSSMCSALAVIECTLFTAILPSSARTKNKIPVLV